jgi:hypothetical protein
MSNIPVIPTQTLLQGKPYVPSHQTDIRKTFDTARLTYAELHKMYPTLVKPLLEKPV